MSTLRHDGSRTDDYVVRGRDNEIIGLHGTFLGFATSQRDTHDDTVEHVRHVNGEFYARAGERCSACRWFEVQIYGVHDELVLPHDIITDYDATDVDLDVDLGDCPTTTRRGRYLVLTSGVSTVPDEVIMRRASWTDSPYEVVELLTQRRGTRPFLPTPSARVLAQAAAWDSGIRDAYVDRAVV